MDPVSFATAFWDSVQAIYGNHPMEVNTTGLPTEIPDLNHGSLWRGCMVLPTRKTPSHTLDHTGENQGDPDPIHRVVPPDS